MTRERSRDLSRDLIGSYVDFNGTSHFTNYKNTITEICLDSTSAPPHTDLQDLYISKERYRPPGLSGSHIFASRTIPWSNYELNVPPIVGSLSQLEPDLSYVTRALARENSETGEFDLGLFLGELREFPKMIKDIRSLGNSLLSKGGKISDISVSDTYLLQQFGVKPFISDILTVLDLQKSISARLRRLNKQMKGESVGGTLEDASFKKRGRYLEYLPQHLGVALDYESTIYSKVWYTLHPDSGRRVDPKYLFSSRSLGSKQPLSTFWNLIPWSFLYDYFFNLGDLLKSEGTVVNYNSVCLMKHRKVETTWSLPFSFAGGPFYGGNLNLSINLPNPNLKETKERKVIRKPEGGLVFTPWLSNSQRANIAALLASNARR